MGLPQLGVQAIVEGVSTYLKDMDRLGKATNEAADQTEKAAKRSEGLSKALSGVGKVVAGLGLAGLFGAMIKEASDAQTEIAELDAVLKSTEQGAKDAAKANGHWASSIPQSQIEAWTAGLEEAQKTVDKLTAKVSAGIVLTKSESESLVEAHNAVVRYQSSLDSASKAKKVWIDDSKASIGVSHMDRQAYLDLADSLQKVTRFSDDTIISAESMLLTFTNIGKDIFPQATEAVLNYATKFGSVEQAAVAIGKALQDPISGVTALRRVGVMLTDQQEEQIKTFIKAGQGDKARAVILRELETEFGGLAIAAGKTFAGKLDILQHKFEDVLKTVGDQLLPVLGSLLDWVSNFIEQLGPAAPALLAFAAAIGVVTLAAGPLGAILGIILSPIGAIVAAVAALGLAFSTNFLGIRDIVESVWKFIGPIVTAIGKDISGIFQGLTQGFDIGAFLSDLGWQLKHGLEILFAKLGIDFTIVQKIIDAFASIQTYVANTLWPALQNFFGWLGGIWAIISPKLGELVKWFTEDAIPAVLAFITDTIIPGIQDFIDTIIRIWTDVSPFLTDLFNWFVNDALPAIGSAIDWFAKNVVTPVIDLLKGLWEAVRPALESLYNWFIKDGLPAIKQIATDLWEKVLKPLAQLLADIWDKYAKPGLEALAKFFNENGAEIGRIVGDVIGGAFNAILTIIKEVVNWAGQAIDKLRELLSFGASGGTPGQPFNLGALGAFTFLPSTFPGHAFGGSAAAGSWSWTGERGPELVHWGQSANIFPAGLSQAISGLMAAPAPAYASAGSYATDQRSWDQSQFTNNFYGVPGSSEVMRRMAILRALGRLR